MVILLGLLNANVISAAKNYNFPPAQKNDLNTPPSANENAILRLEVELRDKHLPAKKQGKNKAKVDLNVPIVDIAMEKVRILLILKLLRGGQMRFIVMRFSFMNAKYLQFSFH